MDVQPRDPAEEIKRLQRCANDLVSVLALPAMWSGAEPSQIVHTLLDALPRMLQLDLVYVRLKETVQSGADRDGPVRSAKHKATPPHEIGNVLKQWLGPAPSEMAPAHAETSGRPRHFICAPGTGTAGPNWSNRSRVRAS